MASTKIVLVLRKKKNKDGTFPLAIRLPKERLSRANDILLQLELQQPDFTLKQLKGKIANKRDTDTFFGQVDVYMETLWEAGKWNRITAEQTAFNHFRTFLKGRDVLFPEITVQLLERFKAYLKGSLKVSERTAVNYLILIRTIYNRAMKEGIVKRSHYPFGRDKFSKLNLPKTSLFLYYFPMAFFPAANSFKSFFLL